MQITKKCHSAYNPPSLKVKFNVRFTVPEIQINNYEVHTSNLNLKGHVKDTLLSRQSRSLLWSSLSDARFRSLMERVLSGIAAIPGYLSACDTACDTGSPRCSPPLPFLLCFLFRARCVSSLALPGSLSFLHGDNIFLLHVMRSFANAAYQLRRLKHVPTLRRWCNMSPQRALPQASLLTGMLPQCDWRVGEKNIYCQAEPSRIVLSDLPSADCEYTT